MGNWFIFTRVRFAASCGHLSIVKYFISIMYSLPPYHIYNKALNETIVEGHLEVVKFLIQADPNIMNINHRNNEIGLRIAAKNNHIDIARYLISQGADLNVAILTSIKSGNKSNEHFLRQLY